MNIALIYKEEMDSNNECIKGCAIFLYYELLQMAGVSCNIIRGKGLDSHLSERESSWRKRCG